MPPRLRTSIIFAVVILFLYVFLKDVSSDAGASKGDILKGSSPRPPRPQRPQVVDGESKGIPEEGDSIHKAADTPTKGAAEAPKKAGSSPASSPTPDVVLVGGNRLPQQDFEKEDDALGELRSAGQIYGSTLGRLVDAGNHDKLHAAALTATDSWTPYNDAPPYTYNPYPAYNSEGWSNTNKGKYVPCDGPNGKVRDVLVFSGHPEALSTAPMGSWHPLNIDNNLCFERETRLAAYGFTEDANETSSNSDWDNASWGALQDFCFEKNSDRYVSLEDMPHITGGPDISVAPKSPRQEETLNTSIADRKVGPKGQKDGELMPKSRTALLLRSYSGKTYTENDKQNIRSLVTELSLRSGGEYQVYLLVQIKDSSPLGTSSAAHDKALQDNVPKEFWDMTVLWDDTEMKTWYPQIPKEINNAHQSQWLSVQKFSEEHPQYDYVWNWELDSRYTGHHYNLLEKLAIFAGKQPRKGLWERNERYYIPALYSDYYDTKFRQTVEKAAGVRSIWGAQPSANMTPTGPTPPTSFQKDDYSWGVGEEADYITLAPIFNPVYSNWIGRNDVWGYGGQDNTTRRATIGTQSRCSRALLHAMHEENVKGNHVSSEMTPQTVAILHGFKAVYAPIPIYIDREWDAKSLEKWFNPGPRGESGSCQESPFGWGLEGRFHGTTWYYRAEPPMRLFFNWMGWEDSGIGGAEWEKTHGRACLPPMLLHPIKDPAKPPPGYFSVSKLPYK